MDADRALGAKLLAAEAAYAELGVNMCFAAADLSGSGGADLAAHSAAYAFFAVYFRSGAEIAPYKRVYQREAAVERDVLRDRQFLKVWQSEAPRVAGYQELFG